MPARVLILPLALGAVMACRPVSGVQPDDSRHIHRLEELAARQGEKPYPLLRQNGLYASERTVFYDTVTGAETWRITHELRTVYKVTAMDRFGNESEPAVAAEQ